MMTGILTEILDFCDRHKIKHTTFGRYAIGDHSFVLNLLNGRVVRDHTAKRIRTWMAEVDGGKPLNPHKRIMPASQPERAARKRSISFVQRPEPLDDRLASSRHVSRDPCVRCGTRRDVHDELGCRKWRGA